MTGSVSGGGSSDGPPSSTGKSTSIIIPGPTPSGTVMVNSWSPAMMLIASPG
jgi:hypothetical protein